MYCRYLITNRRCDYCSIRCVVTCAGLSQINVGTKSKANLIFLVKFRLVFPSDVIDTSEINTTRNLEIANFSHQASKCHRAGVQQDNDCNEMHFQMFYKHREVSSYPSQHEHHVASSARQVNNWKNRFKSSFTLKNLLWKIYYAKQQPNNIKIQSFTLIAVTLTRSSIFPVLKVSPLARWFQASELNNHSKF